MQWCRDARFRMGCDGLGIVQKPTWMETIQNHAFCLRCFAASTRGIGRMWHLPTFANVSKTLQQEDKEARADGRSHRRLAWKLGGSFVRETSAVRASLRTVGRRWG